jgi:uncharacterized protein (DUF488 family)
MTPGELERTTTTAGERVTLWTIGHSNVGVDRFIELLAAHGIALVADVRRYPGSRRHPHFSSVALAASLAEHGIGYLHLPELGGRRQPRADSKNTAWRHPSFRGYADYMETAAFSEGAARLRQAAAEQRTAMMCAEALWWQCHRGLIADAFRAAGQLVLHITAAGVEEHPYTSAARIVEGRLSYGGILDAIPD